MISNKYRWYEERLWLWYLVAPDGEIVAQVSKGMGGPWNFESKGYIDLDSAKRAAENKKALESDDASA